MIKKIVILCPYSYPSACGIWTRVLADANALLKEGYEVHIFSSNIIKGTSNHSANYELYEGLHLHRFRKLLSFGGSSMFWLFWQELKKISPELIHTHGYRHPHSLFSVLWSKLNNKKSLLTTHAPFDKDDSRSIILKIFDVAYDFFIGWWEFKLYDKVIRISKWEEIFLKKLGLINSELITNGINEIFYNKGIVMPNENIKHLKVLYMGRIDPVKRPEWIISAAKELNNLQFEIQGPLSGYNSIVEIQNYESGIRNLEINIEKYSPTDFIRKLAQTDIYILPSIREAMPFTLLEAMSQGTVVISSNNHGALEVIKDGKNGFIVNTEVELVEKIKYIYDNWEFMPQLKSLAIKTADSYTASESAKKLVALYNTLL